MPSYKGINGFITAFVDSIKGSTGKKIAFVGSAGVCTPFIELLAYGIRKIGFDMVFIPDAILEKTKKMRLVKDVGFQVTEEEGDAQGSDIIVILGGLAMPSAKKTVEGMKYLINRINPDAKIIGVGFMGIFEKEGWMGDIGFDVVIDATLDPVKVITLSKENQ